MIQSVSRTLLAAVIIVATASVPAMAQQAADSMAPPRAAPPPPPPTLPAATQESVPADAWARCRDGSYLTGEPVASACTDRGGLAVLLPRAVVAPAGPSAPRAAQAIADTPLPPPVGATAQCKDGTYVTSPPTAGSCAGNGGVAAIFPAAKPVPTAPLSNQP